MGAICIDRRDGTLFIGGNNQSRLPDGNPDFEPWLTAMDASGELKWWTRLYPESKGTSTPDQYVDALAIDYSGTNAEKTLVVVARCHGNNVNNFWNGNQITESSDHTGSKSGRKSFQPAFTGTQGNVHLLWIGRIRQSDGRMLAATFCGEYSEGGPYGDTPFAQENLSHWPDISSGWAKLNTTRLRSMAVAADGSIVLAGTGRRVITTKNALLAMPSPMENPDAKGNWSDFLRVYEPDLSAVRYSTLISGIWDWNSGEGGSPVEIKSVLPSSDGSIYTIGNAPVSKKTGKLAGNEMPVRNVPAWGQPARKAASGVFVKVNP